MLDVRLTSFWDTLMLAKMSWVYDIFDTSQVQGSNIQGIGTTKDDNTTPLWLMIIGLHVYSTLFGNKARKGANKTLIVMYSTLMYFTLLHIQ